MERMIAHIGIRLFPSQLPCEASVLAPPNGLELGCPAEAGGLSLIVAHASGQGAPPHGPARRVSLSELLARHILGVSEQFEPAKLGGRAHAVVGLPTCTAPISATAIREQAVSHESIH